MSELMYLQTSGNDWSSFNQPNWHAESRSARSVISGEQSPIFPNLERQMSEFEVNHQNLLAEVRKHYVFHQDISVNAFLSSHRTIPPLLLQAIPRLKDFFGEDTVFALRAPIDESGAQTLYVVARWPGIVRKARMALDEFDEAWWIPNSRQASGDLVFTYELV